MASESNLEKDNTLSVYQSLCHIFYVSMNTKQIKVSKYFRKNIIVNIL